MNTTYTIRVRGEMEEVQEITVESEHPLGAVFEGLEQLQVKTLESVTGIEVDCVERISRVE